MYVMVCTRPNIAHVVGGVGSFLVNLGKEHWQDVKWILRYLKDPYRDYLCFGCYVDSRKYIFYYMMTFIGEQCHGSPNYKNVLLCHLQRHCCCKLLRNSCECKKSYKSWDCYKKNMFCIMIVKVQSISTRTRLLFKVKTY